MNIFIKHKREILISLVTGLAVVYIIPLINAVGEFLVQLFLSISDKFSDYYYTKVSLNYENEFSEANNMFLIFLFVLAIFSINMKTRNIMLKSRRSINKLAGKVKQAREEREEKNNLTLSKEELERKKEDLLNKMVENEDRILALQNETLKKDYFFSFVLIVNALIFIFFFSNFIVKKSVSNENLIFKNDIIKIKPYIIDTITLHLESDWASIQNKEDFDVVKAKVDSIKNTIPIK
jgi:hypothetical protein